MAHVKLKQCELCRKFYFKTWFKTKSPCCTYCQQHLSITNTQHIFVICQSSGIVNEKVLNYKLRMRAIQINRAKQNPAYLRPVLKNNTRNYIQIRDKSKCVLCGSTKRLNYHHIIPMRLYPKLVDMSENVVMLCWYCHYFKAHLNGNTRKINPNTAKFLIEYTGLYKALEN